MYTFSCKIILAPYKREDGMRMVYLQAIIDRIESRVALGFYLREEFFDRKSGRVKSTHPNAENYNIELFQAIASANNIASLFRQKKKKLTSDLFKDEFKNPSDEVDLIKYIEQELKLRSPDWSINTIKQHHTVINKLKSFRKHIRFGDLNPDLMQKFKNHLSAEKLHASTVNKLLKIVKQYCDDARKKGHEFEDPFKIIRIKTFRSNRVALSEMELKRLEEYYSKKDIPRPHQKVLRYFLFSCFTGLRVSDVGIITWNNISDDILTYIPQKTKSKGELVIVPLTAHEKKYLPHFKKGSHPIFETYTDQVNNRILKKISGLPSIEIKKNLTYHTSRHTFASMMVEGGHVVETQKMLGHGDIKTTMGYVHTSAKPLIDAKNDRMAAYNKIEIPTKSEV